MRRVHGRRKGECGCYVLYIAFLLIGGLWALIRPHPIVSIIVIIGAILWILDRDIKKRNENRD